MLYLALQSVALLGFLHVVFAANGPKVNPALPSNYSQLQPEVIQRQDVDYTGFVFDLGNPAELVANPPNGNITADLIQTNPFLATLPDDGAGQAIVEMGPCAGNTIHAHQRASELSTVLFGTMTFGLVDEDANQSNQLVLRNISKSQTIHIPQGVIHFTYNDNCEPSAFLATFPNRDPGTQTTWNSLMQIPNSILHYSTGIPEATFSLFKQLPLLQAPSTGGEACLRRCGLKFEATNQPLPNSENPAADWNKVDRADLASGPSAAVDVLSAPAGRRMY